MNVIKSVKHTMKKCFFLAIYDYGEPVQRVLRDGQLLVKQTKEGKFVSPVSVLFEGK